MPVKSARFISSRSDSTRERIIVLFVFGVAIPACLLGYLAFRGVRNDQALLELEQQSDLRNVAEQVLTTFQSRISSLDRGTFQNNPLQDLVDAEFSFSGQDGAVDLLSTKMLYTDDSSAWIPAYESDQEESASLLQAAYQLEFRSTAIDQAEQEFERLFNDFASSSMKAEALMGLARIQRKKGNSQQAIETYQRLAEEFGSINSSAGIPYGLVGKLEMLAIFSLPETPNRVLNATISILDDLISRRYLLNEPEYLLVSERVNGYATRLLEDASDQDLSDESLASLASLLSEEQEKRETSSRILSFKNNITSNPEVMGRLIQRISESDFKGAMILSEPTPYYVYMGPPDVTDLSASIAARIQLINPVALESFVEQVTAGILSNANSSWALINRTGVVVAGNNVPDEEIAVVSMGFPGDFPALTLDIWPPQSNDLLALFTSPSSFYLYAFVLFGGLLAGGLALTLRTLSHQLELSRMQSDFVSTVSHELKSPVTAMRQMAEMLNSDRVPTEQRRKQYFEVLVKQSERLSALIDHVLNFARIDEGHAELNLQDIDLNIFLQDIINSLRDGPKSEQFEIKIDLQNNTGMIRIDPDAIRLVLSNLIDNAMKYSPQSSDIFIKACIEDGSAIISVQDSGVGLSDSERDHVFERFYRGGDPLTRPARGTGLGLTIVKQQVVAHGGSITVDSSQGKGSTFTVRLPVDGP